MTQEIKNYTNLNEAIKSYWVVKCKTWWMFINYKNRIHYTQSNCNPKENKIAEKAMIKNIRDEAEIYDRDEKFKKELEIQFN